MKHECSSLEIPNYCSENVIRSTYTEENLLEFFGMFLVLCLDNSLNVCV